MNFNVKKKTDFGIMARKHLCEVIKSFADVKQLSVSQIIANIFCQNFLELIENFMKFFVHRLMAMVSDSCDFFVTNLFIWTISTLSSSLLVFESVK